jgi:hypothetical protein
LEDKLDAIYLTWSVLLVSAAIAPVLSSVSIMRHRIQRHRKPKDPTPSQSSEQRHSKLQPRPFPVEQGMGEPPTQAQQERVARSTPSALDIPLYPPAASEGVTSASGGSIAQMQPNETNLTPPRGTLQRQAVDQEKRNEQLDLKPFTDSAMSEDEDMVQQQSELPKDEEDTAKAIQAKEDEQEKKLQAKAEAEVEEEKADEEIQTKEMEKEELNAKLEQKRSQARV